MLSRLMKRTVAVVTTLLVSLPKVLAANSTNSEWRTDFTNGINYYSITDTDPNGTNLRKRFF